MLRTLTSTIVSVSPVAKAFEKEVNEDGSGLRTDQDGQNKATKKKKNKNKNKNKKNKGAMGGSSADAAADDDAIDREGKIAIVLSDTVLFAERWRATL